MVFVDEVQDARAQVVDRTVRPILSGARVVNPQAWFAGTGERDGSEVLRGLRRGGTGPDPDTLWLEWTAPAGCRTDDVVAWRWASPDWSDARELSLVSDLRQMPEVEFRSEYLVQHDARVTLWLPRWAVEGCARPAVDPVALVAAVEVSTDQVSWSAVVSDGQQVATLAGRPLPEVVDWLAVRRPPVLLAHYAVLNRPELSRVGAQLVPVRAHEAAGAASELGDAVRLGAVSWDNGPVVAAAFAHVVMANVDGLHRIVDGRSRGDVAVVKAMSWALWWARQHAPDAPMVF